MPSKTRHCIVDSDRWPRRIIKLLGVLPMLLLADAARAQSSACDQLKGVLAARIEATGVRGYTLEAVPAAAPVPPDAKAIGNCESGAKKILYRRGGGSARPAPSASAEVAVRPAPRASAPAPVARAPASAPMPIPVPAPAALAAARTPDAAPSSAVVALEVTRAVEPVVAPPPAPAPETPPAPRSAPLLQQASSLVADHWHWLLALALLPIAAWAAWAWRQRYSAYDAAGLPRGPKF